MGDGQQFSLRWNNYLRHITCAFDSLRSDEDLVDVTLSCEGKKIRAHRMLLSACSTYFRDLFKENPCQHPVVIFRNVKFEDLSALVDFMYQGEVNVLQEQLSSFLTTAELLAVQGLSDGNGRDSEMENKETEAPDSPPIPAEPEIQMNSSHLLKQLAGGSNASDVSSPVSFFPVDQSSNSPPSSKRRKWGSGIPSKNSNVDRDRDRELPEPRERRRATIPTSSKPLSKSVDPIEIIPVVPSLKLEMPDYDEQDGSSCSYSDSNQAIGPGDAMSAMSQLLAHGSSATADGKQDHADMYSSNSRDDSLQHSTDSLSAADISQILAKPGPSGENQSQDSLQGDGDFGAEFGGLWTSSPDPPQEDKPDQQEGTFLCKVCDKSFRRQNSLYDHMAYHQGTSKCTICNCVYSRKGNMKRHMRDVHGINE